MLVGTFVSKETTSKEAKQHSSGTCKLESFFNNCELFLIWLKDGDRLLTRILCKNKAKLCSGLPEEETMTRNGYPLWILGRPCSQ